MFQLKIHIENPLAKEEFKNFFSRCYKISKNKFFEFEVTRHSIMLLDLDLSYRTKRDHGGLEINLGMLSYSLSFRVLDYRHWDYKNNRWQS